MSRTQQHNQCLDQDHPLLSQVDTCARPQSACVDDLHQFGDSTSKPAAALRKTRRCKKSSKAVYAFADPLSKTTRCINLSKLARSEFDWRTLTAIRPTTELEERFITRLVELERLQVLHW